MAEEPINEFLRKITTAERKPLSDQEKEEAMVVGRQVWKIAMEKLKGRDSVQLRDETPNAHAYLNIYTHGENSSFRKEDPNTDLSISVSGSIRDASGVMRNVGNDLISFSPDRITMKSTSPIDTRGYDKLDEIKDPLVRELAQRRFWRIRNEQGRTEKDHANKADLQNLLRLISSAQESVTPSVVRS